MIFRVEYSAEARQDIRGIYQYIAYELLAPEAAVGQTDRIMRAVRSLEQMPMKHRLYEEEPWHSLGLRVLPVDHYLVFYLPDETNATVSVIRIMYSGRDVDKQLNDN